MMKAAIFDMDGTLLNSMQVWINFSPTFCRKYGIEWSDDIQNAIMTMSFVEAAEYFCDNYPHIGYKKDELLDVWFKMLDDSYKTIASVKPNLVEYLEKLRSEGIPCAVATMTEHILCDEALKFHGLIEYFDHIITYEDVGGKGKKFPDIFYKSAELLGQVPADCMVFEDSLHAVETAYAAGFPICGIDDNGRNDINKIAPMCKMTISDYSELL